MFIFLVELCKDNQVITVSVVEKHVQIYQHHTYDPTRVFTFINLVSYTSFYDCLSFLRPHKGTIGPIEVIYH